MEIRYVTGDATAPLAVGPRIIVHVCNDIGRWGRGFVLALSKRWKAPEEAYRQWFAEGQDFALGSVQFVEVEPGLVVANLVGQHGIRRSSRGRPPIRYEAVETGLAEIAERALSSQASIHMPKLGCGLAGGRWEDIEPIVKRSLCDRGVPVTVYEWAR